MSDNIFGGKGFAEIQGKGRQRAWHSLGTVCKPEEKLTCVQLAERAKILYKVGKFGCVGAIPNKDKGFDPIAIPGYKALFRDKCELDNEYRFFGMVQEGYTIIQNREIAEMLDSVKEWHVETCGALGLGETVFFALATGGFEIAGDQIEGYTLVTDTKNGLGGFIFCNTPVRVVCQNTLNMGLNSATNKVSLTHGKAIKAESQELIKVYQCLEQIKNRNKEELERLVALKLTEDTAKSMIEAIYPMPEKPKKLQLLDSVEGLVEKADTKTLNAGKQAYENAIENTKIFRAKVSDLYSIFNDQFPKSAGSSYALYNVVCEMEDHIKPGKGKAITAESTLFGDRARIKSCAYDLLLKG